MVRRARLVCVLVALGGAACNGVFGVDGLTYGTAASSAGSGAAGGGGGASVAVVSSSSGAGGRGGAGGGLEGGGGTGPLEPCGKFTAFGDDFEDDERHPMWGVIGTAPGEFGGELSMAFPPTQGTAQSGLRTRSNLDFRDSEVSVEVTKVATGSAATTTFEVDDVYGNRIRLSEQGDDDALHFFIDDTEVGTPVVYDSTLHRWWRLRHAGAQIHFETSADGATWNTLYSHTDADSGSLDYMNVAVFLEVTANASDQSARFDNLNGGSATSPLCAASSATDDFSGSFPGDPFYAGATMDCTIGTDAGVLQVAMTDQDQLCGYRTRSVYDLRDDAMIVELVTEPASNNFIAGFRGENRSAPSASDSIFFGFDDGELVIRSGDMATGTTLSAEAFAYAEHRWLRFREAGGVLYGEASPDGATWNTVVTASAPFPVDALEVGLSVRGSGTQAGPREVRFDNLNVAPGGA